MVGLILFLTVVLSAPQIVQIFNAGDYNVLDLNGCEVFFREVNGVYVGYVSKPEGNVHFRSTVIPDCSLERCEVESWWENGAKVRVTGSVVGYCVDGECTTLTGGNGPLEINLGKKNVYTFEVMCATGETNTYTLSFFPVKFEVLSVGVVPIVEAECRAYRVCLDTACGKDLIRVDIPPGGKKFRARLVCDGRVSEKEVFLRPVKGVQEAVAPAPPKPEANLPELVFFPEGPRLVEGIKGFGKVRKLGKRGKVYRVEDVELEVPGAVYELLPEVNTPPAKKFFYVEANGNVLPVRIRYPGVFLVWKYDGREWRFLGEYNWVFELNIVDNGPFDLNPAPGRISDPIGVGTGGLVVSADLDPGVVDAGGSVTVYGYVEKNGTPLGDYWINIFLDGNRLGGPTYMIGPSDWFDRSWKYRREINITNPSGVDVNGYQVRIELNLLDLYQQGKLRRDAADLRFTTKDGNLLYYWIQSQEKNINPVPVGDDDQNVDTKDVACEVNPYFRYYETPDTDGTGSSEAPTGWYLPDFNDEGWYIGTSPFGATSGSCTSVLSYVPSDLFVRKTFDIPGEPIRGELNIAVGGGIRCYVNGVLLIDELNNEVNAAYWNHTLELNNEVLKEGTNLLACWVAVGGENNGTATGYFDVNIGVSYYERILPDVNVWVKVDLPATGTTIYMYYGNPDANKFEDYNLTFDTYNVTRDCQGSTAGGSCGVVFDPLTELNSIFFEDQRYGFGTLDFLMSGDFDLGGAYADPTNCTANTSGNEVASVYVNGNCYGTYSTGYQDCTDRRPDTWPKDMRTEIEGRTSVSATGDTSSAVNFAPATCYAYYYHFVWTINAKTRKYMSPEPSVTIGPEMMDTSTDPFGNYSWTFTAPDTPGEHTVRVEVNDGNNLASVSVPLFVRKYLKIWWADILPRVKTGYSVYIVSSNSSIDEVNLTVADSNNVDLFTVPCSTTDFRVWLCDLNMYEINIGSYILKAFGYSAGVFTGFDAKYTEANSAKDFEFATDRDVNDYNDVTLTPEYISLKGVLAGFSYRRPITLDNPTSNAYSSLPVKIVLDTATLISQGKMKSDCSDVRFTDSDGVTELPYWLERGCNTGSTVFWVKVRDIPAWSRKTIYVYYGNPRAPSGSDGSKVFDFFDDMESWEGWVQYGTGTVQQSSLYAWTGKYSLLKTGSNDPNGGYKDIGFDLNYPFVLEAEIYRVNYNGGSQDRIGVIDYYGNGYGFALIHGTDRVGIDIRTNFAPSQTSTAIPVDPEFVWYHAVLIWKGDGNIIAEVYDSSGNLIGSHTITDTTYTSFRRVYVFGGYEYLVDDIRIRPYVENPPVPSVGAEEVVPSVTYEATGNWLGGFSYRDVVEIDNTAGTDLSDFQVRVVVDTATLISQGKMKSDCSDVRFTDSDGVTELPYWLERGCNTGSTVFWVKVPSIPGGSVKTIYMYYGNPSATSASDGSAVFEFFDGFESWTGWSDYGGGTVLQDCNDAWEGNCSLLKTLNNDPNGGIKSLGFTLNFPFVLEAYVKRVNYNGGSQDRIGVIDDFGNGYGVALRHGTDSVGIDVRSNYSATAYSSSVSTDPEFYWYVLRLIWNNGTLFAEAELNDGTGLGSITINDANYSSFTNVYVFGGYDYRVDALRIRKYASPEPEVTVRTYEPRYVTSGYVEFNLVEPIKVATWTYLEVNADDVRDTNVVVSVYDDNGTLLCRFDITPGIVTYDISGCTVDKNALKIRLDLYTYDHTLTPVVRDVRIRWIEDTNIKLIEPSEVYQFRNELMYVSGWLRNPNAGCTEVNAYLYFKTRGTPHTLMEYNYDHFITRSYDENVSIGDSVHPQYLHPNLGYYFMEVNVSNPAGVDLYDYQVKVVFDSKSLIDAGKMRSDCGDIRVVDENYVELNFWLKDNTCNTQSTEIWVLVPHIPPSGTKLYIYHGRLDYTSVSNPDAVFYEENSYNVECQGSVAGGVCTTLISLPAGKAVAPYQPSGYAQLDMLMSGDFGGFGSGEVAFTSCDASSGEVAAFWLNGVCLGTYATGWQDCTDRRPSTWPKDVLGIIEGATELNIVADAAPAVNFDPGCGYYYHYAYSIRLKFRNFVSPEPTTTVSPSRPDVYMTAVYVSDALDTGVSEPIWGSITWGGSEPAGTLREVYVRTSPDGTTWSQWYPVKSGDTIPAPSYRYIEYNVVFRVDVTATDIPVWDDLKIIYYTGVPDFRLVTSTDPVLSTSSPNPYLCGALAQGAECYPEWNTVPKDKGEYHLLMNVTSDCGFEGNSNEKIVYVFARTQILNFSADKNVVAKGDTLTLTGQLIDELGNPVIHRTVRFYDGNTFLGEANTDDTGNFIFTFVVPTTASVGYHTLYAKFPRDPVEYYWESEASTTVKYTSKPVIKDVLAYPSPAGIGDTVRIEATVTDEVGISSVVLEVNDPEGVVYTYDMNCSGSYCYYDFNDTWKAGGYIFYIKATNLDGITSEVNGTFSVEGYATFGVQVENNAYGALEDVLLDDPTYWASPLSTYSFLLDATGVPGRDVVLQTSLDPSLDPFGKLSTFTFFRSDLEGSGISFTAGVDGNAVLLTSGWMAGPSEYLRPEVLTITAWIRIDSNVGTRYVISLSDTAGNDIYALYSPAGDSNICFSVRVASGVYTACSPSLSLNTWYHVAASFDGSYLRLYVNGSLADYNTLASTEYIDYTNVHDFIAVGSDYNGTAFTSSWNGAIDDLRIYPALLYENEIISIKDGKVVRRVPLAHWKFDGNLSDSSPHKEELLQVTGTSATEINVLFRKSYVGTKNAVTVVGVSPVAGYEGNGGYFNGTAYIEVNGSDPISPFFSVALWVNPDVNGGTFVERNYPGSPSWYLGMNASGNAVCSVRDSGGNEYSVVSSSTITGWTHVACVFSGVTLRIFVNGVEENSVAVPLGVYATDANIIIGNGFTGTIDDVRVYRGVLSSTDVRNLYLGEDVPWGLTFHLSFDTNDWNDESGDWLVELFSGGWASFSPEVSLAGTTISGSPVKIWKRSAICNVGDTNVSGYLYIDVQTGAGSTWSTVPPIPLNDLVTGRKRTVTPGECLSIADIYNPNPWNTDEQPAGLYRVRMVLLAAGGSPSDTTTYVTLSDGKKVWDYSEFNIVAATLTLSDINHAHLADYNLNEYETTDTIWWVDVYVTARDSTALDVNVTLTLTDEFKYYAGFGPNNETKYYGTIYKDTTAVQRWDNEGSGYYIPEDATSGTYAFRWLVEMNTANGPSVEDFTRYVTIHNLPSEFNSSAPTRIYYYDTQPGSGIYTFCMKNPWSRDITDVNVTINCPSGVGITCYGTTSGTITESVPSLASGASVCFDFNIVVDTNAVSGDYNFDVNVEYINPAGNRKFWPNQQRRVIEIRKAGILEILLLSYPTDVVRGEENAVFISKAHNTGTVNDENAWIAYTYPADWNAAEVNTDGTLVGDVNAFKSVVPPDGNIELNVVFVVPITASLGPQLVRIETGTATNPDWGDFKNVYVTVWDRPVLTLEANDYNASVGESIRLTAYLTYSDGTPLANQRVNFEKNGVPIGATDTNADGYATIVWDLSAESPGTYIVRAFYDGNTDIYTLPAEDNVVINIGLKPEVNAWLSDTNVGYGIDVNIEANATDDQGISRVWAVVTEPDGSSYEVNLTNDVGNHYYATIQPWKEGDYNIVVYAEDLYGSVSSSDILTLHAVASARMGVETDKNFYLQGEGVNLVPPDWWDINWSYRKRITITNNTLSSLSNYVVRVTVDTETPILEGKMRSDLNDVRFISGNTELNFWWEEVITTEGVVPRASDDLDPTTSDLDCTANPSFKYYYCLDPCEPIGWYTESYDDSAWSTGYAPFGATGGECTTVLSSAPDDLFVRKWFTFIGKVLEANLYVASDDGVRCYLNEVLVLDDITGVHSATYWNYEVNVENALREGNNLLACWVANGGENAGTGTGYLDVELRVKYVDYANPDTNFWVVIPLIPAGGDVNIYMYYGNPDATRDNNVDIVFPAQTLTADCNGSSDGGACSVKFPPDGYTFAPYQKDVNLEFYMSGDFDLGGAFSDPTTCVEDTTNERAAVYVNGVCYGTYSTGFQDCTDRQPAGWPRDVTSVVLTTSEMNVIGDSFPQVNWDPGCGYFYHFLWNLVNVRLRPYVSPEPSVSVGPEETISGSYLIPNRLFKGYLIGVIERNENGTWVYVDTDFNDINTGTLRTFYPNTLYDLSLYWVEWNTFGQPEGIYRARIGVYAPDGTPLTYLGNPIEEWNIFEIGPPPVDVNISDFRVYDINGVLDPRTEGNLVDSGLQKTIYLSADRPYRFEIDVTVTNGDWNVADSNVIYGEINALWNVLDIWYTLPGGADQNGGTFDGNVEWNTLNDGSASSGLTITFKFTVDLNTLRAEEYNTVVRITHRAFVERTNWVVISTYVPDVFPPEAVEYNLINLDTNQVGWEINAIRSFESVKIYAEWNEVISDAYVEYNGTSSVLTTDTITPDGNYTEYIFTITSFWLLGPHVAKIHAADLSGNWNHDLNFLVFYVWGIADVSSIDLNDTNIYQGETVEINCTVVDRTDSNNPIAGYPTHFYVDGSPIGTVLTNSSGVATTTYTFTSFGYHTIECNVETNTDMWYLVDPPYNEKSVTVFVKETVPPEWNEVNYPTKIHRGEIFDTNVHWTDNHQIDTVLLYVDVNGTYTIVDSATFESNDVWAALEWNVPTDEPLGLHHWYQEANDPSGNVTDTNVFEFNVWGWASISQWYVSPPAVNPDQNVTMYCKVIDRDLGTPLSLYEVNFYWDGNYVGTSDTNADGWAWWELNVGSSLGLHTFECRIGPDPIKLYDPYPGEDSRSETVNVTESNDTDPPDAVEWNVIDLNTGVEGKEINIYRGDDLNFWSLWDENLSSAWVIYSIDGVTEVNISATVDGNRAYAIIDTNSDWARGLHTLLMKAADEANNISIDANSAEVNVYVWVYSNVRWVSPTGTVNQSSDMNAICFVYEGDTGTGIPNYTVAFYSSLNGGTFLGTADTNADGYATLFVDLNAYYGTYTFWCEITDDPARYYEANILSDSATITVAAINLKATWIDVNTASPADENVPVLIEGNILNEFDPVDANVEILVERREGDSWVFFESYRVLHSFDTNEENTFSYTWITYPGTYRMWIIADPDNRVSEENELDNNTYIEFNVHSWSVLYGDVNLEALLGSGPSAYYIWSGGSTAVVVFYDSDLSITASSINGMSDLNEIRLADQVLGMAGSWDSLESAFDADGDGNIDAFHTFFIEGRAVSMPVIYEENRPVGIGYSGTAFDGNQPIVFVTEVNEGAPCSYGTCDYLARIPALLRKQDPATETVTLKVFRS